MKTIEEVQKHIESLNEIEKIQFFENVFLCTPNRLKWDGVNGGASFFMAISRAYNAGKQNALDTFKKGEYNFIGSETYFRNEFDIYIHHETK